MIVFSASERNQGPTWICSGSICIECSCTAKLNQSYEPKILRLSGSFDGIQSSAARIRLVMLLSIAYRWQDGAMVEKTAIRVDKTKCSGIPNESASSVSVSVSVSMSVSR